LGLNVQSSAVIFENQFQVSVIRAVVVSNVSVNFGGLRAYSAWLRELYKSSASFNFPSLAYT
jgi:hypothetical protein